jgi:uracil phosphoribosyltransferase
MQVIELSHPLKNHYLTILRDKNTTVEDFRTYASKLSYLLILEGSKNISLLES